MGIPPAADLTVHLQGLIHEVGGQLLPRGGPATPETTLQSHKTLHLTLQGESKQAEPPGGSPEVEGGARALLESERQSHPAGYRIILGFVFDTRMNRPGAKLAVWPEPDRDSDALGGARPALALRSGEYRSRRTHALLSLATPAHGALSD